MIDKLFRAFAEFKEISTELKKFLTKRMTHRILKADEFLLLPGQVCKKIAFNADGLMHGFRVLDNRQQITRFFIEGSLCIEPMSYFRKNPSLEYIAPASKDCTIYEMDASTLAEAFLIFPDWFVLFDRLVLNAYLMDEMLLHMFRTMSAKERYEHAQEQFPGIENNVFRRHYASWLGVSEGPYYDIKRQDRQSPTKRGKN